MDKMRSNRKDLQRKAEIELGGKMPILKKLVNKSYSNILISYMKLKLNKKVRMDSFITNRLSLTCGLIVKSTNRELDSSSVRSLGTWCPHLCPLHEELYPLRHVVRQRDTG